jgi:Ca-activated chloride channel family protein
MAKIVGQDGILRPIGNRPSCVAVLAAILCAMSLATLAQESTFRVDVNLVRILATVKDNTGRLIGDLEKQDFTVSDNGAPQQIAVFERRTEQPLLVSLLIDNSGSTAKDLKYEIESVNRFLRALSRAARPLSSTLSEALRAKPVRPSMMRYSLPRERWRIATDAK